MDYLDGGRATMLALRDLKAGEELTLAYVSPFGDLDERLTHLWRTWGFVCTCRRCQDQLMKRVMERGAENVALEPSQAVCGLSAAGVAAATAVIAAHSHKNSPCPSPSGPKTIALAERSPEVSRKLPDIAAAFQPPTRAVASEEEASDNSGESGDDDGEEDEESEEEDEES